MFDLPYILTHPLLRAICVRCAELNVEAIDLPAGSLERKEIEKRLSRLEEYRLPKPEKWEQEESEPIKNRYGQVVGESHSIRRRFKAARRGRPSEWSIKVRTALEEKLANSKVTWEQLAEKFGFKDRWSISHDRVKGRVPARVDLERQARLLKALLRQEGILVRIGVPPKYRFAVSPRYCEPAPALPSSI